MDVTDIEYDVAIIGAGMIGSAAAKYASEGCFQLKFVSVSQVINHMTCYISSALIGWNYSIQTEEQIL